MINEEKQKVLEAALGQIEKHTGKRSVKNWESGSKYAVWETVLTGSFKS